MMRNNIKSLLFFFLLFQCVISSAQSIKDTVSLAEIFKRVLSQDLEHYSSIEQVDSLGNEIADLSYYHFQNLVIIADSFSIGHFEGDSLIGSSLTEFISKINVQLEPENNQPEGYIDAHIEFYKCIFIDFLCIYDLEISEGLGFSDCQFYNDVHFGSLRLKELRFENSTFNSGSFIIENSDLDGEINFQELAFKNSKEIWLKNNTIRSPLKMSLFESTGNLRIYLINNEVHSKLLLANLQSREIYLSKNTFLPSKPRKIILKSRGKSYPQFINERIVIYEGVADGKSNTNLFLGENVFLSKTKTEEIRIEGRFAEILIFENEINWIVDFGFSQVKDRIVMEANQFNSELCVDGLIYSELFNSIEWEQINGDRLTVRNYEGHYGAAEEYGRYLPVPIVHTSQNMVYDDHFSAYRALIRSYKTLFDIFRKNGDLESANGCYAEMKKVETRRWKYEFDKEGSFESFFRWQLNVFLSYFTDYGTNPSKAVVKSGWVILLFAIFYLFFPSDWDVSNRSQLLSKIRDLASKNREKSLLATLGFVLYSSFIHILNALTLSLNAFTTLGFGDIPTHGAARYVTIVQGFIGWFLLTIFSVSLINQVLG